MLRMGCGAFSPPRPSATIRQNTHGHMVPTAFSRSCAACCVLSIARVVRHVEHTAVGVLGRAGEYRCTSPEVKVTCRHSNGNTSLARAPARDRKPTAPQAQFPWKVAQHGA